MKNILLYLWQLPQNLVGLLLVAIYKPERKHIIDNGNIIYFSTRMLGGISLGKYSLVNIGHYRHDINESLKRDTVRHEAIGHAKQSLYLGWLYLLIIGLPSIAWAGIHRIKRVAEKWSYYAFYTEKWADRIAGVKR